MLKVTTSNPRVHGFAARSRGDSRRPYLRVFLLNKMEAPQPVSLSLHAGSAPLVSGEAMVDTEDHWGERSPVPVHCGKAVCISTLPAVSLVMFTSDSA